MNLIIDGNLTYPPSEISCVRDVTLYSTVWTEFDVLIEIERQHRDHVWKHLRMLGAYDYIEDIVSIDREPGLKISDRPRSNIVVTKITCENLNFILSRIRRFG
jgi:hypothetical protein